MDSMEWITTTILACFMLFILSTLLLAVPLVAENYAIQFDEEFGQDLMIFGVIN
jgi:hypothetical protein